MVYLVHWAILYLFQWLSFSFDPSPFSWVVSPANRRARMSIFVPFWLSCCSRVFHVATVPSLDASPARTSSAESPVTSVFLHLPAEKSEGECARVAAHSAPVWWHLLSLRKVLSPGHHRPGRGSLRGNHRQPLQSSPDRPPSVRRWEQPAGHRSLAEAEQDRHSAGIQATQQVLPVRAIRIPSPCERDLTDALNLQVSNGLEINHLKWLSAFILLIMTIIFNDLSTFYQ